MLNLTSEVKMCKDKKQKKGQMVNFMIYFFSSVSHTLKTEGCLHQVVM